MRLFIRHATIYTFAEPQTRVVELLRLTPSSHAGQNVIDWQIDVDCDARLKSGRDGHGNEITMLYVQGPVRRVRIEVTGEVLTDDRAGVVAGASEPLPPLLYTRPSTLSQADAAIAALADEAKVRSGGDPLAIAHGLMTAVHHAVAYERYVPAQPRPAPDVLASGRGVAQDHAHVMVAAARHLGYPARYVSGHLWRSDDDGPRRATHAWAELHVDGYGWIGFDPANDHCPDDRYVRVAAGLDYTEAAPILGARVGGGAEFLEVTVNVSAQRPRR